MKVFYSDQFALPLPEGHRFPLRKYARLRERLLTDQILNPDDLFVSEPASDEQLTRVHTETYVRNVCLGLLTEKEMRRIGFPWSPQMVERSRRSVGGTIGACRAALADGIAANLAGGTHHAFPDFGAGFCVFNDVAVAACAMLAEERVQKVVILDCDVHQGDGTAAIFAENEQVFTFSIHGAKNFPFHKQQSDLDIEVGDGIEDQEYLRHVSHGVTTALTLADADLAIYIAGADPFSDDRLGRMNVSKAGLLSRDQFVLESCAAQGIPTAIVLGGGYARNIEDVVDIHARTIQTACELQGKFRNGRQAP